MASEPVAKEPVPLLLVDDSPVQRRFLRSALESCPEFSIVGEARNGREAVAMVERLRPAAVLMDLDLPVMNGIEAIERIMASRPTPIVVYSAFVEGANSTNAIDALAAGAVDVVAKPQWGEGGRLDEYAEELRRRMRVASRVKVITHPRGRLRTTSPSLATAPRVRTAGAGAPATAFAAAATAAAEGRKPGTVRLVAIGASTGGPQALATVLGALPEGFAPAVLVVQHMAEGFIPGLVSWLDQLCPLPVAMGATGRRLAPGTVTVAPSGLNLLVRDHLRVVCEPAPERQFHVPGIDASFESIAETVGAEALGVILTGMGRDGAAGLKAMRERGAVTIGQDEATCAVYGMPAAAWTAGAVEHQLPLPEIAPLIRSLVEERT
ncbi:MAG TPA: chemotaxis-specific protein-glutamate methyltransferase CheB [Mycobacteriales bacterium]|jgi:two-component system chemotaxis response regulator CheB|nr:chemotaxis-specific protein-glutamate methyltransferase CheB [Mycobacteriales bacterium]